MSPKPLPPKARRQVIRDNILTLTYEQLAEKCYCTKRTIVRDVNQWRDEGGFEECLFDEFVRLYPTIKNTFPERAFDRLCYLIGKTMTRKMEVKKEVKTEHRTDIHILLEQYEGIIERAAERNLPKDRA